MPLSTASSLMAKSVTCTFCKGPHSPNDCSVQMSVEARFNKVREAKACFRCGRSEHQMAMSQHRKPCQCGQGSHILQPCKTGGVKMPDVCNSPPVNSPSHQFGILRLLYLSLTTTKHHQCRNLHKLQRHLLQGTLT